MPRRHYVGGADALAGSLAATDVRVGVNPAQAGAVRLANNQSIDERGRGANTRSADQSRRRSMNCPADGTSSRRRVSPTTVGASGVARVAQSATSAVRMGSSELTMALAVPVGTERGSGWKITAAGKSRLMVRFATGAAVQIAIEP